MIRSIEMMLGLDPMNKFDSVADPMVACFSDRARPDALSRGHEQRAARRAQPLGRRDDRRPTATGSRRPGRSTGAISTPPTLTG